jgi:membrane protease YdiL (CAAX protease family)
VIKGVKLARMQQRSRTWYAVLSILVFVAIDHLGDLLHQFNLRRFMPWLFILAMRNFFEVGTSIIGVMLAHRSGFKNALRELGMAAPAGRGVVFALIATAPMLIAFAFGFHFNPKMTFLSVAVGCLIAPFAEEVIFRAYLFKQLYQRARFGFWLSALIPSVLFALGHVYQSSDPKELAGILAVTGIGGIFACWLFKRWQYNLWIVVGLHAAMNLWWEVFAVDDTALGGWLANGARLLTIACAVLLTIFKDKFWPPLAQVAEGGSRSDSSQDDRAGMSLVAVRWAMN